MVFDPPNQKETHLANEAHLACVFFFKFKPHQKVASKGYIEAKKTKLFQACLKNKKNTWFGVWFNFQGPNPQSHHTVVSASSY